jgi:XTP/dITP diphosphohydrolase
METLPRKPDLLLVGTANRHKISEISSVLADLVVPGGGRISVVGSDALPPAPPVEETGATFRENAEIKARAYGLQALALPPERRPRWVLADDSGLCVDALRGAPGVLSARYAGEGATDGDNNLKLLAALLGTPPRERGAEFVCVMACALIDPRPGEKQEASGDAVSLSFFVEGRCRGQILEGARGAGGFGYDPLFLVPSLGKTFAELTQAEKNERSHRGLALQVFRRRIEECLKTRSGRSREPW